MGDRYGLPYMGSKNKIADWVLSYLPSADNFYDLCCGGCAITHCAIVNSRYGNYYINDIKREMPFGFLDCINGVYSGDYRWISRDDFERLKGSGDLLVDICFSFGNNWRKGYAYSCELEPYKRALHYAILHSNYTQFRELTGIDLSPIGRYNDIYSRYNSAKNIITNHTDMQNNLLENLERLLNLERLQRINDLYKMRDKDLHIYASSLSYDEVDIKPNSVIYMDIPYRSTAKYNDVDFDYDKFYSWALSQSAPVFISEYNMPDDFVCIAAKHKTSSLSATNKSLDTVEKLFVTREYYNKMPRNTLF